MPNKVTVTMNPALRTRALEEMAQLDTADMARLRDRMDSRFKLHERSLFATEGAAGGSRWPELSSGYAKSKARKFPGRKILQRTGRLRRSLTEDGAEHVATYALRPWASVTLGTKDTIAAYHTGRLRNPRTPERDPLQHTPTQMQVYLDVAAEYFTKIKLPRALRVLRAWSRSMGR